MRRIREAFEQPLDVNKILAINIFQHRDVQVALFGGDDNWFDNHWEETPDTLPAVKIDWKSKTMTSPKEYEMEYLNDTDEPTVLCDGIIDIDGEYIHLCDLMWRGEEDPKCRKLWNDFFTSKGVFQSKGQKTVSVETNKNYEFNGTEKDLYEIGVLEKDLYDWVSDYVCWSTIRTNHFCKYYLRFYNNNDVAVRLYTYNPDTGRYSLARDSRGVEVELFLSNLTSATLGKLLRKCGLC